jgi:AcrR family transcriptional regulator
VLVSNPAASIEQIAEAAGVSRATVHRRFANRDALLSALGDWAAAQLMAAVDAARPETSPPLVALYQATANLMRVKIAWQFGTGEAAAANPTAAAVQTEMLGRLDALLLRARDAGLLRADADLIWARRAYHALLDEVRRGGIDGQDPDALATLVVSTFLHGVGTPEARL